MITPEMKAAGWRECPTDAVRREWESKGGRWQVWQPTGPDTLTAVDGFVSMHDRQMPWRPVHPSTWDYDYRGWGPAVPTMDGPPLWWRKDERAPILVFTDEYLDGGGSQILRWLPSHLGMQECPVVVDDGQWLAPCVKPGVV